MNGFKRAAGAALILALGVPLWAQQSDPLAYLSQTDRQTLESTHELTVFGDQYQNLRLWKGSPFEAAVKAAYQGRSSTMAAEGMFVIPLTGTLSGPEGERRLVHSLTAISTMAGLQVWSVSLKRVETFIFDAYRVGTLNRQDRLADPDPATLALPWTTRLFQKEEQTGESFSKYTVARTADGYQVSLTNLTSLKYGFVPLVSPGDLLTTIFVVPLQDRVLVYGITVAKTFDLFGLERSKNSSLYTRMKALVTWFTRNLNP